MAQNDESVIDPDVVGPLQRRLNAITETWTFDILVRVIYVAWFFYLTYGVVRGLGAYFRAHGSVPDAMFISTVLARMAVIVFFATLMSFVIIRLRPVRKSQGLTPRLAAFFGTFVLMSLSLFPAREMSLAGNVFSALLVFAGSGLCVYAVLWLGRSLSIMPEARRLVTGGPYAFVRHPLYLAEEISIIGTYFLYASPWTTLLLILHGYLQIKRMGYEEEVLRQAFPDYDTYAARTSRLIPGLY